MEILEFISIVKNKTLEKSVYWDQVDSFSYRLTRPPYSIIISKNESSAINIFTLYSIKILNGLDVIFERNTSNGLTSIKEDIDNEIATLYNAVMDIKTEELNKQLEKISDLL